MTAISISRTPTVFFFEVRGGKIGLRGECFFNENVKEFEDFFHKKREKTRGEIMLVPWVKPGAIRFDKTAVVRRVDVFEMHDVGIIASKPVRLCAWWERLLSAGDRGDVSVVFMERSLFSGCFSKCLYSAECVVFKRGVMGLSHFFGFNAAVGETGMKIAGGLEKFCMVRVQQNKDEKGNNCATDVMKSTVFCVKCVTGNVAEMAQHLPQRKPQPEGELEFNSNKGGGGEIPRCMRGSPFWEDFFSSPPPIFSERVKSAWGCCRSSWSGATRWCMAWAGGCCPGGRCLLLSNPFLDRNCRRERLGRTGWHTLERLCVSRTPVSGKEGNGVLV